MTGSESWDDKEMYRDDKTIDAEKKHKAVNKFPDICVEYAKINSIELSPLSGNATERLNDMYNLLNDPKFIDFALDKYGIEYSEKMFRVPPIPDYREYKNERHQFKIIYPKNVVPVDHGDMVCFTVENAPKIEFGKINIFPRVLVHVTPGEEERNYGVTNLASFSIMYVSSYYLVQACHIYFIPKPEK
ncbi:MAG TPA: hypothetical protein VF884_00755 [Nitrososphaeraceae archaeon]